MSILLCYSQKGWFKREKALISLHFPRNMESGTKHKTASFLLIAKIVFAVLIVYSATMLVRELWQAKKEADTFAELSALKLSQEENSARLEIDMDRSKSSTGVTVIDEKKEGDQAPLAEGPPTKNTIDGPMEEEQPEEARSERIPLQRYLPLYERNQDYFAWITIPGTKIDYPVMYNRDQPQWYLNHDFDGNRSSSGVLFLDSDCDPNGKLYIVYGHNMSNGTMFGGLLAYRHKSYWEKHSTLSFDTLYEERTYVIAVAMRARALGADAREGFRYYYYTSLDTEEVFEEYMQQVRQLTLYDTGIDISFGDELLLLSTCHYFVENGRFVVIAKRIA